MRYITQPLNGYDAQMYICNLGEGLPMHTHTFDHGHWVVWGRTSVIIGDATPRTVTIDDGNIDLPANIPHSIQALDDGTTFINLMPPIVSTANNPITIPAIVPIIDAPPPTGGVMLADGTVVYP